MTTYFVIQTKWLGDGQLWSVIANDNVSRLEQEVETPIQIMASFRTRREAMAHARDLRPKPKRKRPCTGITKDGKPCSLGSLAGIPVCLAHARPWTRANPRSAVLARPRDTTFSVGSPRDHVVALVTYNPGRGRAVHTQSVELEVGDAEVLFDQLFLAGHLTEPPAEPGPANRLHVVIELLKAGANAEQIARPLRQQGPGLGLEHARAEPVVIVGHDRRGAPGVRPSAGRALKRV